MDLLFDVLNKRKKSEVRKFIYGRMFEFVVVFVVYLFGLLAYSGKIGIQESITAALIMPVLRILVWISFHFHFQIGRAHV